MPDIFGFSMVSGQPVLTAAAEPAQRCSMPYSLNGITKTVSPSRTSLVLSGISIRQSAQRSDEIKPEPSRSNFSTCQPVGPGIIRPRQSSRRPILRLGNAKAAGMGKRRGSGQGEPLMRRSIGQTYIRKQTNTATGFPGNPTTVVRSTWPSIIGRPGFTRICQK